MAVMAMAVMAMPDMEDVISSLPIYLPSEMKYLTYSSNFIHGRYPQFCLRGLTAKSSNCESILNMKDMAVDRRDS